MKKIYLVFIFLLFFQSLKADKYIDSLRMVMQSDTISDDDILWTYNAMTDYLMNVDIDQCREICKEAISYAIKVKNFKHEIVFTSILGTTYYYQGDYKTTAEYWLNALSISENAKDTLRIEQIYNNLGILYQTINDYETSSKYYFKSLELKKNAGDKEKIAITQMNIGALFHKMQLHDSAYVYLSEALSVLKLVENHRALSGIYNNLGAVHQAKKEYELAMENYDLAYELKEYLPGHERARLLMNMGSCLMIFLNKDLEGRKYLEESYELAQSQNNLNVIRNIYGVYSHYYYNQGNYKEAYDYLELENQFKDSIFTIEKDIQIKEMQANFDFERREQELNQKMELEKIANERQIRISRVMISLVIIAFIVLGIISYLFTRVRKAKRKLEATQLALEKTNADLRKAKSDTERALEFKSQFLANMSHEVRTPLNAIIGFNSKMKTTITDPKVGEYLDAIEVSSYNLLALLNDVLNMSKIEAGKIEVNPVHTNLKSLIHDIWYSFHLSAKDAEIEFSADYDETLPEHFYLDQVLLRQILVNLVGNALKFTHHGYVKISVRPSVSHQKFYASSTYHIDIVVEDTGIGIKPEDQRDIFESFVQAKHQESDLYRGTGLGLAISKKFSNLMGGDITLISKPGKGSTFTVSLHKVSLAFPETSEFKRAKPIARNIDFQFTGGVLLVADDEELNRKVVQSFFVDTAVELHVVENGEQLIEKAKEIRPTLILSDMKMPVKNGIEAAKVIKADPDLKDIPIIAFTASIDFPKLDAEIRKLFSGCINKPVDISELYQRLSFYLPTNRNSEQPVGHP
ncbi:MAG: tetratricopeptide repeat protein [Bacteroidales bacterium]|nr:tetratricopeptide repeat protein [Bacteroidales bacterium]